VVSEVTIATPEDTRKGRIVIYRYQYWEHQLRIQFSRRLAPFEVTKDGAILKLTRILFSLSDFDFHHSLGTMQ
jgi:hypothetical protein